MLNPERIIGSLMQNVLTGSGSKRRRSLGLGGPGTLAVASGLLGVAIAAYEHYAKPGQQSGTQVLPPHGAAPSVPPPLPPVANPSSQSQELLLFVRAMIAAAHADGQLDDAERRMIASKILSSDLDEEERALIERELNEPRPLAWFASQRIEPALAERLYALSLLSISVDSEQERKYLADFAGALNLAAERASAIERELLGK